MATPPLRVLIVDDSADTSRMMKVLLRREGHEARTALDGPEALEAAREFRPDVVLLDQVLPGMSGAEVAEEIRGIPELAGCVLVAVSGRDAGPDGPPPPFVHHFRKPVDHDALMALLAAIRDARHPGAVPTGGAGPGLPPP